MAFSVGMLKEICTLEISQWQQCNVITHGWLGIRMYIVHVADPVDLMCAGGGKCNSLSCHRLHVGCRNDTMDESTNTIEIVKCTHYAPFIFLSCVINGIQLQGL